MGGVANEEVLHEGVTGPADVGGAPFEAHHRRLGVRLLEAKTLGPSHADEGYRATRAFYIGVGFVPVEELWIWGPDNPALILWGLRSKFHQSLVVSP